MTRHRANPPLAIYRTIAITFITVTIAIVAVVFYFAISYAYITIHPRLDPVTADFTISVVRDASKARADEGVVAGKIFDTTVTGSGSFETKGTATVVSGANGRVKLMNAYSKDQTLVATTRLLTSAGTLYRLSDKVVVPSGGSVEAEMYPDDSRAIASVTIGERLTIPGLWEGLQDKIYAEIVSVETGAAQTVAAVSPDDLSRAEAELVDAQLQKLLGDSQTQVRIIAKEITSREWSAKAGDRVSSFTGSVTARIRGVVFDEAPVRSYAEGILVGLLPEGKQLIDADKLIAYEVKKIDPDGTVAVVHGTAKGHSAIAENNPLIDRSRFIKLKPAVLKAYVESLEGVESVDISFFPSWNRSLPRFEDHIMVTIAPE